MTCPELLSAIYANYDRLLAQWDEEMEKAENIGVFAFLPEGYSWPSTLDETKYTFWPVDVFGAYVFKGGETDKGLLDLLEASTSGRSSW